MNAWLSKLNTFFYLTPPNIPCSHPTTSVNKQYMDILQSKISFLKIPHIKTCQIPLIQRVMYNVCMGLHVYMNWM